MNGDLGEKYRLITTANNELAQKAERAGDIARKNELLAVNDTLTKQDVDQLLTALEQANNANMALVKAAMDEAITALKKANADLGKAEEALGKLTLLVGWLEKLIQYGIGVRLV